MSPVQLGMRFDLRAPDFGAPSHRLAAEAVAMAAWADARHFDVIEVSEHHGTDDGYCPSPVVLAAAMAAVTRAVRLRLTALVLPLYDPIRLAEDLAVLDLLSDGRLDIVVVPGYRKAEFDAVGRDFDERGRDFERAIGIMRQAWTGEPFTVNGRPCRVTPRPRQRPHPPLSAGGSSPFSARRAARLDMGLCTSNPVLIDVYRAERQRLGADPGPPLGPRGPFFLHIAEDPDEVRPLIAPHALHEANSYAEWFAEASLARAWTPARDMAELADLARRNRYEVMTPAAAVQLVESLGAGGSLTLHPLVGGLDPDLAWQSLELFDKHVRPRWTPVRQE